MQYQKICKRNWKSFGWWLVYHGNHFRRECTFFKTGRKVSCKYCIYWWQVWNKTGFITANSLFIEADSLEACQLEQSVHGTIITHASITAKPFFEKRGFSVVKEQSLERQGLFLTNYIMEKDSLPWCISLWCLDKVVGMRKKTKTFLCNLPIRAKTREKDT